MNPLFGPVSFPALSPPSNAPHFRKRRAHRPQSRVRPLRSVPLVSHLLLCSFLTHHLIRALRLPVCRMRRRPLQQETAKGWGELPPHLGLDDPFRPHNMGSSLLAQITLSPHSFPPQHLVLDIVRLYIAFNGSETDQGADQYYVRVTSTTSLVKTSVYLVETVVSDLFIVRLYLPSPFSQCALYRSGRATSYIGAMLYGTRVSPPSFSRSFYISPTLVCPPHHPRRGGTLNASFRDRDRGNLRPVAHRAGCCLRQEARANHKLILRLHSCLECRLHRCVLYCICILPMGRTNVLTYIPFALLSPRQDSSRSASGGPRSRRATPRWVPTL
jgi:hypothetical protein